MELHTYTALRYVCVFVCSNGVGRTGVFIALHIILERLLAEGLVDVFQTVKNLRIQRPAMVQTLVSSNGCGFTTSSHGPNLGKQ